MVDKKLIVLYIIMFSLIGFFSYKVATIDWEDVIITEEKLKNEKFGACLEGCSFMFETLKGEYNVSNFNETLDALYCAKLCLDKHII